MTAIIIVLAVLALCAAPIVIACRAYRAEVERMNREAEAWQQFQALKVEVEFSRRDRLLLQPNEVHK